MAEGVAGGAAVAGETNVIESVVGYNEAGATEFAWFTVNIVGKVARLAIQLFTFVNAWKKIQYIPTVATVFSTTPNIDPLTLVGTPLVTVTADITSLGWDTSNLTAAHAGMRWWAQYAQDGLGPWTATLAAAIDLSLIHI